MIEFWKQQHPISSEGKTALKIGCGLGDDGFENFWSLLKRTLKRTSVPVAPYHLFRRLEEQSFRYNKRKDAQGDGGCFKIVVRGYSGKRLTHQKLTGK